MDVSSWLVDTVYTKAPTGSGSDGDLTYGSAVAIPSRVESAVRIMKLANGMEFVSNHTIVTEQELTTSHMIWLPGENPSTSEGQRPKLIKSAAVKDGSYRFYEVYL
jgi:hypothetical protein